MQTPKVKPEHQASPSRCKTGSMAAPSLTFRESEGGNRGRKEDRKWREVELKWERTR